MAAKTVCNVKDGTIGSLKFVLGNLFGQKSLVGQMALENTGFKKQLIYPILKNKNICLSLQYFCILACGL